MRQKFFFFTIIINVSCPQSMHQISFLFPMFYVQMFYLQFKKHCELCIKLYILCMFARLLINPKQMPYFCPIPIVMCNTYPVTMCTYTQGIVWVSYPCPTNETLKSKVQSVSNVVVNSLSKL